MKETDSLNLPSLSVVIPALNAASTIRECLHSVLNQNYPGKIDIAVAVGPSKDKTLDILDELAATEKCLKVLDSPEGRTATSLNLAIASTQGEIVARVDAQSVLPKNYFQQAVSTLLLTGAANVGGIQKPVGKSRKQICIANAMQSPFGSGTADFRGHGEEGPTDTVYLGTFQRSALNTIGGFDESFVRNQDYELNWRLREAGYVVWFEPKLCVHYTPRKTFGSLAVQYFQYGSWKRIMLLKNPRSLRLRQVIAPMLLLGLISSFTFLFLGSLIGIVVPAIYLVSTIIAAAFTKSGSFFRDKLLIAVAFIVMHLSWGGGFLFGFTSSNKSINPPLNSPNEDQKEIRDQL